MAILPFINKVSKNYLLQIKNTLFVGKVFMDIATLPSTNQYALELVSKSAPKEGTVVSTFRQSAGRGQIGSKWESEPDKNLTISVIFYPRFLEVKRQFLLNQVISLAVADLLVRYVDNGVKVKWPNDIYVHDTKLAGILIQNSLAGTRFQSAVAGIGLNVNQRHFSSETSRATSLSLLTGKTFDLYALIEALCQHIEIRYLQLKKGLRKTLEQEYIHRLYRYQQPARYELPNGQLFTGTITGLSTFGHLVIETDEGPRQFDLKEIRFC